MASLNLLRKLRDRVGTAATWLGGRFRTAAGAILGRKETSALVTRTVDLAAAAHLAPLAEQVASGSITVDVWLAAMRTEVKNLYFTQYVIARGGLGQMTFADWGRLGAMLKDQYGYLDGFAGYIKANSPSAAYIAARAHLYANASHEAFERARTLIALERGADEVSWDLNPAEHCSDCVEWANMGWQPIGPRGGFPSPKGEAWPGSGLSKCLVRCRCSTAYRNSKTGEEWIEAYTEGGFGSGWYAPPRGTHGPGSQSSKHPSTPVLTKYLSALADIEGRSSPPTARTYNGFASIVNEQGVSFTPQPLPLKYSPAPVKECYANAFRLSQNNSDLTYVEGYAVPDFVPLPMSHAWVVDKQGNVIDNTWEGSGVEYVGVPLTAQYVRDTAFRTGVYRVFSHLNFELLADGFPDGSIVKSLTEFFVEGGPGSGHWGHAGRPPDRGGSAPSGGVIGVGPGASRDTAAMSIITGPTAKARQAAAAAGDGDPDKKTGPIPNKLPYKASGYYTGEALTYATQSVVNAAEKHDMSDREYEEALTGLLAEHLAENSLISLKSARGAMGILEDGRFKTQHETGRSHGSYNPGYRIEAEERGLGTPSDLPIEKRPVYGYIYHDGHTAGSYGEVAFILKDSAKERTTVTVGDSLVDFHIGRTVGRHISNPDSACWSDMAGSNIDIRFPGGKSNPPVLELKGRFSYLEAQVHGGVTLKDVKEIVLQPRAQRWLKNKGVFIEFLQRAERANIPVFFEQDYELDVFAGGFKGDY